MGLLTFDRATVDSAGVFLISELERLDQKLHMPLSSVTWSRDITLREDVSMGDELSSFTQTQFAAAGGPSPNGKNWIGKNTTAIAGVSIDIGKTATPLTIWGMELGWTIPELESAMKLGRPVDQQKFAAMNLKYQMDIDEQVYIGDGQLGVAGLLNAAGVTATNAVTGNWATATPDQILSDINVFLNAIWAATGYAVCPSELRLPPVKFGLLVSRLVSTAGNISILEYIKTNCVAYSVNGRPLNIQPLKWCTGRGAGGTDRAVAYTNENDRLRFPLVPMQRTPMEFRGINQLTTYFSKIGSVEFVYPETVGYLDNI